MLTLKKIYKGLGIYIDKIDKKKDEKKKASKIYDLD